MSIPLKTVLSVTMLALSTVTASAQTTAPQIGPMETHWAIPSRLPEPPAI